MNRLFLIGTYFGNRCSLYCLQYVSLYHAALLWFVLVIV